MRPGVCLKVKSVGKPDAVAPHVRFDERGWETERIATAPVLDSTGGGKKRILQISPIKNQISANY